MTCVVKAAYELDPGRCLGVLRPGRGRAASASGAGHRGTGGLEGHRGLGDWGTGGKGLEDWRTRGITMVRIQAYLGILPKCVWSCLWGVVGSCRLQLADRIPISWKIILSQTESANS